MLLLIPNRAQLRTLKNRILEDATNDESELKDRKVIRCLVVGYFLYTQTSAALVLAFPVFSRDEFAMPIYMQLPLVE